MSKKILLTPVVYQFIEKRLKDNGIEVVISSQKDFQENLKKAKDVDALILMETPFPNSMFDEMPNLKIIARQGVGYDNVDTKVAAKHHVWVSNTPGGNAVSVAEYAITDMLILSKNAYLVSTKMREGDNSFGQQHMSSQVTDKTLGIIGYGHIGQEIAKRAVGLGMKVLIYNRTIRDSKYGTFVSKDEIFEQSDYISLNLPAVKDTIHLVTSREFKMMKNSAYIINLGRGPLIKQDDLVDALKNKEIAGAALDVYEKEPLPMDSQLRTLDNVFLTPHCSGNSTEAFTQMANQALDNILAAFNGKKPTDAVNEIED